MSMGLPEGSGGAKRRLRQREVKILGAFATMTFENYAATAAFLNNLLHTKEERKLRVGDSRRSMDNARWKRAFADILRLVK